MILAQKRQVRERMAPPGMHRAFVANVSTQFRCSGNVHQTMSQCTCTPYANQNGIDQNSSNGYDAVQINLILIQMSVVSYTMQQSNCSRGCFHLWDLCGSAFQVHDGRQKQMTTREARWVSMEIWQLARLQADLKCMSSCSSMHQ